MGFGLKELLIILFIGLLVWTVKALVSIGADLRGTVVMVKRRRHSRPPAVMESIVRLLVPPASREHVMGDLCERHRSPRQYLADALGALPFIIASRVRRTCDVAQLGILAILFWFGAFCGSSQASGLVATIPMFLIMVALVLRDAYRTLAPTWPREAAIDVAIAAACVLIFEAAAALIAPALLLSQRVLLVNFPVGCVVLFFVRLQSESGVLRSPAIAGAMSMPEVLAELRGFEAAWRRVIHIEIGSALVVAACVWVCLWAVPATTVKIGSALMVGGALFVAGFLNRYARVGSMPEGLRFTQALDFYARALQRRSKLARRFVWWYIMPLAAGPTAVALELALRQPSPAPATANVLAVMLGTGALLVQMNMTAARKFQQRLDQLARVSERQ